MTTPFAKMNTQLMFSQTLAASLEAIINKVLSLESASVALDKIRQKTLTLALTELGFALSFTVTSSTDGEDENKTILVTSLTEAVDCTIDTSIKTLRELKANQPLTELIKQGKLDVTGDIKVAQEFANLLESFELDWQSELANQIGDVPTQKLQQLSEKIRAKFEFAKSQIQADAGEYIVHEKRLVVTKSQIAKFNQDVNTVDKQVAELEARIARLTNQSNN